MLSSFSNSFSNETNEEKINHLYDEYINLIFYIVSGFFKNHEDIEDTVYEVLQKIIKNIDCIEKIPSNKTKAFISTIAKNTCITVKNKQNKIKEISIDEVKESNFSVDYIQNEMNNKEIFYAYKKALLSLPKKYYEIIYLRFYENLPLNKISTLLCLSNETVYQRYHRAKKLLAKLIKEELNNE